MRKGVEKGDPSYATVWVTFVNMKSKTVLLTVKEQAKAGGFGFRGDRRDFGRLAAEVPVTEKRRDEDDDAGHAPDQNLLAGAAVFGRGRAVDP